MPSDDVTLEDMLRPRSRVEEIRVKRGLKKSELARMADMPPSTLQRIEDGSFKTLSPRSRQKLAMPLQVREDQLLMPIGYPIDPLPGEGAVEQLLDVMKEILTELRFLNSQMTRLIEKGGE